MDQNLNACAGTGMTCSHSTQFQVGGSLYVGDGGLAIQGGSVSHDVFVGSDIFAQGASVGGPGVGASANAFCAGDISGKNTTIYGDLYTHAEGTGITVTGSTFLDAGVVVPAPCDCTNLIDIAGIVANALVSNDNAAGLPDGGALSPDEWATGGGATNFTWPCGRYYLSGVDIAAPTTWTIAGRTAIFVGTNVSLANKFTVNLQPGAEIDLFIAGNLTEGGANASLTLGNSPATVANTRVYVAGSGTFAAPGTLYGDFYAPNATLTVSTPTTIYGSVFAYAFDNSNPTTIYYDEAVLESGLECPDAGPADAGCSSCLDCGDLACIGGACTSCVTDADCCSPLACSGGLCVVL